MRRSKKSKQEGGNPFHKEADLNEQEADAELKERQEKTKYLLGCLFERKLVFLKAVKKDYLTNFKDVEFKSPEDREHFEAYINELCELAGMAYERGAVDMSNQFKNITLNAPNIKQHELN